jgi:hypothetical protein
MEATEKWEVPYQCSQCVTVVDDTEVRMVASVYGRDAADIAARARLIAAAPDLLAAVSDLLIVADEAGCDTLAQQRARAAIAKAEGGAQ